MNLSKNKEDYSDYISYASNVLIILSLFSGFTFASITIIVTQLPDPGQILIQVTLFFLAVILNLFLFLAFYFLACILHCVENVPPETKLPPHLRFVHSLLPISFALWGLAVVMMFLFWNLVYLALASFIMLVVFIIWNGYAIARPMFEHLRKRRSQK